MKKFILFLYVTFSMVTLFAQTATNADGTIKHRGNVAIMVTSHAFTFQNGVFEKMIDDDLASELGTACRATAMSKFGKCGFGIVNRDDVAYNNVQKVLKEQKLEDYIDGFSVQAKGEGADCLCLIDNTFLYEKDICQQFMSCRIINITNNVGLHYSMKSEPFNISDPVKATMAIRRIVESQNSFLEKHILDAYPEQYALANADGKKLYLSPYQPVGSISESDKFYAFKYSQESLNLGQQNQPVTVLEPLATATTPTLQGGYCMVKSDKALSPSNDIVLFRNQSSPRLTTGAAPITFFALSYDEKTYKGFIINRVNNAVYDALTRHPGTAIIEQEHLPELKKERELQKTEDFIDGHVVEQMKAFGAIYMIHLENFIIDGSQVSFTLNMISIAQNQIARSVNVITSIDNIENEMYKQICERFTYPCNILQSDKKNVTILSGWSLERGEEFIVVANKPMKNPVTGEISYTKVDVCKCVATEPMGDKLKASISEIISDEDFKLLSQYSSAGAAFIKMDGSSIKSNTSTRSSLEKEITKEEKKEKRKAFFKGLGGFLKQSVTINKQ